MLNPECTGGERWSAERFYRSYPGLVSVIAVPVRRLPNLAPQSKPSALKRLILFLTGGLCVFTVSDVLRKCGEPVPRRILTAKGLHDWLAAQGWPEEDLA